MAIDRHRAIQKLPVLRFRGLEHAYYDDASFSFAHTHAERLYPNVDRGAHRWTGLEPEKLTFNLYFLNSLEPLLFPNAWNAWHAALLDGTPAPLRHPLLGERLVVVNGGDVQLTSQHTSGVICRVTFTRTIRDPGRQQAGPQQIKFTVASLAATLKKKNTEGIFVPDEEAAVLDLLDLLKVIDGAILAAELDLVGLIERAKGLIEEIRDFTDKRLDATQYEVHDTLTTLWANLTDLAEAVGVKQARKTKLVKIPRAMSLDAFARDQGNTLAEAIELNPDALATPTLPAGKTLRAYVA